MRRLIIPILLAMCFTLYRPVARAQGDPVGEIIWRVNALRAAYGVPAYQVDPALMTAAQAQASWSAANNHFGHDGPGGSTPLDRALAAGYGGGEVAFAIENVASGTISLNTPELVVSMWQGDWGHLNAMISADYEHIGVGYAEGVEFNWYVMMVGWVGEKASAGEASTVDTPIPFAPFTISTPGEDGAIYHEVQPGQAAWTIAVKYGIPLADLLALNGLTEDSWLHPGDLLLIRQPDPQTSTPTKPPAIHTPTLQPTTEATQLGKNQPDSTTQVEVTQTPENMRDKSSRSDGQPLTLAICVVVIILVSVLIFLRSRPRSS